MKTALILSILILSNSIFAQIPGKSIEGPIVLFDTLTVKQGDIIYLGKGSEPETGNFMHLYVPKNTNIPLAKDILSGFFSDNTGFDSKAIPQENLDKNFEGKQLVIKGFSKVSSKRKGKKNLGVINMKEVQFIEDVFFNNIVVDFEPAIKSGEIIKISTSRLAEKASEELLFLPFVMTNKGIELVVVTFINLSKTELYNKATNWANSHYEIPNQATITSVQDERININDIAKNVKFGTILGINLIADLPYLFTVDFTDSEITMAFNLGNENGDIFDENGEVIANISPEHMFNRNGEVNKMSQVFKEEAERIMNDISYSIVDYLKN